LRNLPECYANQHEERQPKSHLVLPPLAVRLVETER
jgi:hypothetical protein